jgi:translocation and assembly module TamA
MTARRIRPAVAALALGTALAAAAAEPKIEIEGADGALAKNIRAGLSLTRETCDSPQWRVRRVFRDADPEIERAARALGYYHVSIEKDLERTEECWRARFRIDPGEPVIIRRVDVRVSGEAGDDPAFANIAEGTEVRPGARLHHGRYKSLKGRIEELAAERGYFDGRFTESRIRVRPEVNEADIRLHYDSGGRYRFGEVRLKQDAFAERFLERFVNIASGDPYSAQALAALHRSLADSGYFTSAEVRPRLEEARDRSVPVDVRLEPRKRLAYRFGIGVATDTGPRLSAAFENRRINRLGHQFKAETRLAPVDSTLGAEYTIPLFGEHYTRLGLGANLERKDTDSALSESAKLRARLLGTRAGWTESPRVEWVFERSTIADETSEVSLLVPGVRWSRTEADNRLRPKRGWRASLDVQGAYRALLSDLSFVQVHAQGKWIASLGPGRFLTRAELGATETDDFGRLPVSYRFFAGGDQSVRGYVYESLGPKDADGNVVGGRYLATGSLEYEHPVRGQWSAAVFADAGNALNGLTGDLKASVGAGVRWQSPVGPLRLDLAFPVADTDADLVRLHFSMGPEL